MVPLPLLPDRSARRVYHVLAWLHVRRTDADRDALRDLRAQAFRLGLRADAAREVEAEARTSKSIRVGRDPEERQCLEECVDAMTQRDPALQARARALVRRAVEKAHATPSPGPINRSPFEASEEGPSLVPADSSRIPAIVPQRVAPRCAS
jgi:predicted P-loop ATPase